MKKFTIIKKNGNIIPCISEISENCKKIAIVIHGMCSSKESANAAYMMNFLPERGIGVVAYDQPGHGEEEAKEEELRIGNCLDSLNAVEEHLKAEYPEAEICYFGSSFGAYILGIYLAKHLNSGNKAFMRCAAVIFPQMILGKLEKPENAEKPEEAEEQSNNRIMKDLEEKGYVEVELGIEKPARFTGGFIKDLKENDLLKIYEKEPLTKDVKLYFVHGEKDPVVSVGAVQAFAAEHGYPITVVEDEEHSISNDPRSPKIVAELAYKLFVI